MGMRPYRRPSKGLQSACDPTQRKRGSMRLVFRVVLCVLCVLAAAPAHAQVQTGSITGSVTVTMTGDRLIGGSETQVTDTTGNYRFDRLPPGSYGVKFELQGFKGILRE